MRRTSISSNPRLCSRLMMPCRAAWSGTGAAGDAKIWFDLAEEANGTYAPYLAQEGEVVVKLGSKVYRGVPAMP